MQWNFVHGLLMNIVFYWVFQNCNNFERCAYAKKRSIEPLQKSEVICVKLNGCLLRLMWRSLSGGVNPRENCQPRPFSGELWQKCGSVWEEWHKDLILLWLNTCQAGKVWWCQKYVSRISEFWFSERRISCCFIDAPFWCIVITIKLTGNRRQTWKAVIEGRTWVTATIPEMLNSQ